MTMAQCHNHIYTGSHDRWQPEARSGKPSYTTSSFLPDVTKIMVDDWALPPALRTLEQFQTSKEVLQALHDSILVHQEAFLLSGGLIHGNITPSSIALANPSTTPELTASDSRLFLLLNPPPSASAWPPPDARFQSVNNLMRTFPGQRRHICTTFPADYSDDLESYWYILAYMSMGFPGPGVSPNPFVASQRALRSWAIDPSSREAILEKETLIKGQGFSFGNTQYFWNGFLIESLLDEMHVVLKNRHYQRLELARPRTYQELKRDSAFDYATILASFKDKIEKMEYVESHTYSDEDHDRALRAVEDEYSEEEEEDEEDYEGCDCEDCEEVSDEDSYSTSYEYPSEDLASRAQVPRPPVHSTILPSGMYRGPVFVRAFRE